MNIKQSETSKNIENELSYLKNYALMLTRNYEEAQDLVQETVLKALRYQDNFQEGTNFRGWLTTILKNTFINQYRRDSKRNTFLDVTDNLYFIDLPSQSLDNDAELKFIRKDLNSAIDSLPNDLKITFQLNAEGFKYNEISDELNIPLGTVKTRIFTAKRLLRSKLWDYSPQYKAS